jgi:hypothetical protein
MWLRGKADVVFVQAVQKDADAWSFAVTVRHDDRDPDHWADWWIDLAQLSGPGFRVRPRP